jgi:hypothetical protein
MSQVFPAPVRLWPQIACTTEPDKTQVDEMRKLALYVMIFGIVVVMSTAFVAIDGYFTEDRKAEITQSFDDYAQSQVERERRGRKDRVQDLFKGVQSVRDGILKSAPIDLETQTPQALEGWVTLDYEPAHLIALLGHPKLDPEIKLTGRRPIFKTYSNAAVLTKLGAVRTYKAADRMAVFAMEGDLKQIKRGEKNEARPMAPIQNVYARLDGVAIEELRPFYKDIRNGYYYPTDYRRFRIRLDRFVTINMITDAADLDVLELFAQLDMAALQASMPYPTTGYTPGTGLIFTSNAPPSADKPAPNMAQRAVAMIRAGHPVDTTQGRVVLAIAQGLATDWQSARQVARGALEETPELRALLGPLYGAANQTKL